MNKKSRGWDGISPFLTCDVMGMMGTGRAQSAIQKAMQSTPVLQKLYIKDFPTARLDCQNVYGNTV